MEQTKWCQQNLFPVFSGVKSCWATLYYKDGNLVLCWCRAAGAPCPAPSSLPTPTRPPPGPPCSSLSSTSRRSSCGRDAPCRHTSSSWSRHRNMLRWGNVKMSSATRIYVLGSETLNITKPLQMRIRNRNTLWGIHSIFFRKFRGATISLSLFLLPVRFTNAKITWIWCSFGIRETKLNVL